MVLLHSLWANNIFKTAVVTVGYNSCLINKNLD
ncbi:hypothetical protein FPSM_02596 [Flavobacterium psychrophilum]|nr:hypothetical protein FPSM_02596 [Flavobacterium psychrophilum]